PAAASRLSGRPFDYEAAGLRLQPVRANLAVVGGAIALTWPFFFVGFLLLYGAGCGGAGPPWLGAFMRLFIPACEPWQGWAGAHRLHRRGRAVPRPVQPLLGRAARELLTLRLHSVIRGAASAAWISAAVMRECVR